MLFCDQLEDFASPQTPKKTRSIEVERFRDFIVELLPMADMVSVVVTMHPRALASIEEFWQLADLPSLRVDEANRHIVVVMPPLGTLDQAKRLLGAYLNAARRDRADRQSTRWRRSPRTPSTSSGRTPPRSPATSCARPTR